MTDPLETPGISRERAEALLEELAADRYGAELLAPDGPGWYDALAADGSPIELKACAVRVRDGRSRRRGRWLVRQRSHRELLEADGRYVLGVYDARPRIVAVANVSAERVDRLLADAGAWFSCPSSDQGGDAKQLRYATIFPELDELLRNPEPSRSIFSTIGEGVSP